MTSKIVVNNIESDAGISSVTLVSNIAGEDSTQNISGINSVTATSFHGSSVTARSGISCTGVITATQSSSNIGIDLHATSSGRGSQIKLHNDHGTSFVGVSGDTEGDLLVYNQSNADVLFATNNSERLRILNNGKIFVGAYSSGDDFSDEGTFLNIRNNTYGGRIGFSNNTATAGVALMEQFAYWGNNKVAGTIISAGTDTTNKDDASMSFYTRNGGSVTERLKISSDGYVTKPNTPFFSVYGTANNQTYNQGDIITFENASQNVGNHFKMTSGTGQYQRFIAPVAGVYLFTFAFFPNTASSCRIGLRVSTGLQTTPYISGCFSSWGTGSPVPSASQMLLLGADAYVDVVVANGTLTNTYDGHTTFQGILLG